MISAYRRIFIKKELVEDRKKFHELSICVGVFMVVYSIGVYSITAKGVDNNKEPAYNMANDN